MDLSPKTLIKLLKAHGWELDRIKGSHHVYINTKTKQSVPVPIHGNKDLKLGTYKAIIKVIEKNQ